MNKIIISDIFSKYPGGRYYSDGEYSGQAFRENHLIPSLKNNEKTEVVLDGAIGFGSSFLEEAFGGLIREGFTRESLHEKLTVTSNDRPSYLEEIKNYIENASIG